jgi:predicted dehydrogenase
METVIRYALIGCGRIAPNHVSAALAQGDSLQIVALCDIRPENMQKLLEMIPEEKRVQIKIYTDYEAMLKEIAPDLCAVATESGKHAKIAMDCIEAGAHVIIEKPIALSLRDADNIIQTAREKGRLVCACHQNRFNRSIQKMRGALEAGEFGRLLHGAAHVRWNRGEEYYRQAPWRGTWEQDGGALMNQCIHNIDLLRWMMGDCIDEVFAYTDKLAHEYIEAEDLGLAVVRFSNGSYGLIEGTTNVYPKHLEETLYVFGERGTVKVGGKSVNQIHEWLLDGGGQAEHVKAEFSEDPPNVYGFGHTPLYADMLNAIRENRKPYIDGEAGRRALELVLAIYKSAKEKRPVRLPLDDYSTMDMAGTQFISGRARA